MNEIEKIHQIFQEESPPGTTGYTRVTWNRVIQRLDEVLPSQLTEAIEYCRFDDAVRLGLLRRTGEFLDGEPLYESARMTEEEVHRRVDEGIRSGLIRVIDQ